MGRFRTILFVAACVIPTLLFTTSSMEGRDVKLSERCSLWVDLLTGEPVPFEEMIKDLSAAEVVYIGETHSIERHHEIQAQIVRALRNPDRKILLGLEQMEASFQGKLDLYNKGEIDFETLAAKTDWGKRWSNYRDYREVMEAVREGGGHAVALNARLETVRAVARDGLAALKEDPNLPAMVLYPDEPYAALLRKRMNVHGFVDRPAMVENMVTAQMVRDEAMAQNLSLYMGKEEYRKHITVVLAGSGHVSFGMGVPDRLRKRLPAIKDRIVLISDSGDLRLSAGQRAMARDSGITREDLKAVGRPLADYLHLSGLPGETIPHRENSR